MIVISVTRRRLRHDGAMGAKAVVIQIDGDGQAAGDITTSLYPDGCRGVEAAAVWRRTPRLVDAEAAIQALVEEVRTTLGDLP